MSSPMWVPSSSMIPKNSPERCRVSHLHVSFSSVLVYSVHNVTSKRRKWKVIFFSCISQHLITRLSITSPPIIFNYIKYLIIINISHIHLHVSAVVNRCVVLGSRDFSPPLNHNKHGVHDCRQQRLYWY